MGGLKTHDDELGRLKAGIRYISSERSRPVLRDLIAQLLLVRVRLVASSYRYGSASCDGESLDSRAWMSAVTESGGWSASTATRMPRSV
jgi:hypothetical protein